MSPAPEQEGLRVMNPAPCTKDESKSGPRWYRIVSSFEAGSYLMRIDFVYHSYLGLRVIKKKRRTVLKCQRVAWLDSFYGCQMRTQLYELRGGAD